MKEIFFTINESMDGGYEANAVGHSIYTQCNRYEDLHETIRDAIKCHFDTSEMPSLIYLSFVRSEAIAL